MSDKKTLKHLQEAITKTANTPGTYRNFTGYISWGSTRGNVKDATFSLNRFNGSYIVKWSSGVWVDGSWSALNTWSSKNSYSYNEDGDLVHFEPLPGFNLKMPYKQ